MEFGQNGPVLLDFIKWRGNYKTDAALARALKVAAPVISKIRHGTLSVGAAIVLRIHELEKMPVADIRKLLATHV